MPNLLHQPLPEQIRHAVRSAIACPAVRTSSTRNRGVPVAPDQLRPRLCFAGSADDITYDERWGGVHLSIAGPLTTHRTEVEHLGWQVHILDGLDHTQAMQPTHVLPVLRPWLTRTLLDT
ncbi:hypothetical protein V6U90_25655 [Micromonospora sp. CPCC 206060]|uniref:hypothetical protein n=1 Tax=Micromonospora sp. CPCC 206060 TaxID=3122406 RepID=UPI002FEF45B3